MAEADQFAALKAMRVLLAEDDVVVAMSIRDVLALSGCRVVTAARLDEAMDMANTESLDGALLCANLGEAAIYPAAEKLAADGVPLIFLTRDTGERIQPPWDRYPALEKPGDPDRLRQLLVDTFAR